MNSLAQQSIIPSFAPIRTFASDITPSQRNGYPFSFSFFNAPAPVTAITESAGVIIEKNGIFCIADIFEPAPMVMNIGFKQLVDSVIGN